MSEAQILLRPDEAARQLNLSRSKVYLLLKTGQLPCVRIGRSVRVPQERLKQWVAGNTGAEQRETTPSLELDIAEMLDHFGLSDVRPGVKAMEIAPALVRFADAIRSANPLIRHVAREELLHRLTKARVRTPGKMLALAFGDDRG